LRPDDPLTAATELPWQEPSHDRPFLGPQRETDPMIAATTTGRRPVPASRTREDLCRVFGQNQTPIYFINSTVAERRW
jgi:hypothetical protein